MFFAHHKKLMCVIEHFGEIRGGKITSRGVRFFLFWEEVRAKVVNFGEKPLQLLIDIAHRLLEGEAGSRGPRLCCGPLSVAHR